VSDELLTTAEAARLAGVGASSVKRWADQNLLRCLRTAGGHRRFRRDDFEAFLREHGEAILSTASEWVELALNGGVFEIQGELLRARDRLGAWYEVANELGAALAELGARWERREISVIDEHVASEKLTRAIERAVDAIPTSDAAPRCLLATAQGDEHTLGLSLVELCLREAGWSCVWSGRNTPLEDLAALARSGRLEMLALSASSASTNEKRLRAEALKIGEACREANVLLVFGGNGGWPEEPPYGTRLRDLRALHRFATDSRAHVASRR
jgi:excisionase family DNA binding protein